MNIVKFTNYSCGILFIVIGLVCFIDPVWFMALYDTELKTPQSKTEIRAISGFIFSIGYLFCYFTYHSTHQMKILYAVIVVIASYVISRILGLLIDGFDQRITYFELAFETITLIIVLAIYFKNTRLRND